MEHGDDWSGAAPPKEQQKVPATVTETDDQAWSSTTVDAESDWSGATNSTDNDDIIGKREVSDAVVEIANAPSLPDAPETGVWQAVKYTTSTILARRKLKNVISDLSKENSDDSSLLDQTLSELGTTARSIGMDSPATAQENVAISASEKKIELHSREEAALQADVKKSAELYEIELTKLQEKLSSAKEEFETSKKRRDTLADEQKETESEIRELEKRTSAYEKTIRQRQNNADEDPEVIKQSIEALTSQISEIESQRKLLRTRHETVSSPLESANQNLNQRKELIQSIKHEISKLEKKFESETEELRNAESEVVAKRKECEALYAKQIINLGTLLNEHRESHESLVPLYRKIDGLSKTITSRQREMDRLDFRRSGYDRQSLKVGLLAIGGVFLLIVLGLLLLTLL